MNKNPRVAIIHDYLVQYGGAEKVLEALHESYPNAPIYTSFIDKRIFQLLKVSPENIKKIIVARVPGSSKLYKHVVPLYPFLFSSLKIDADVIISSSTFAAKFVNKRKAVHVCYLHTAPRFLWGYETELAEPEIFGFDKLLKPIYKRVLPVLKKTLKKADYKAAQNVDFFIANSEEVKKRIKKHYDRDAFVINPPVDTARFTHSGEQRAANSKQQDNYFLIISRLSKFKKIDVVVEAFNKLKIPLKIVGEGIDEQYLKSIASKNIEFLGQVSENQKVSLLQNCKAVVFPTDEDFGIVPLEAMAAGKPVLAFRAGGALETVKEGVTGEFFDEQKPAAIIGAVRKFNPEKYSRQDCTRQAGKFSKQEFERKMRFFVEEVYASRRAV